MWPSSQILKSKIKQNIRWLSRYFWKKINTLVLNFHKRNSSSKQNMHSALVKYEFQNNSHTLLPKSGINASKSPIYDHLCSATKLRQWVVERFYCCSLIMCVLPFFDSYLFIIIIFFLFCFFEAGGQGCHQCWSFISLSGSFLSCLCTTLRQLQKEGYTNLHPTSILSKSRQPDMWRRRVMHESDKIRWSNFNTRVRSLTPCIKIHTGHTGEGGGRGGGNEVWILINGTCILNSG